MPAGLYRDRCDIRNDGSAEGNPVADYTTYAAQYENVPCDVTAVTGMEVFRGRQVQANTSHVVEMQYIPDVIPTAQVSVTGGTLSGRTLAIVAAIPIDFNGRTRKLRLECREVNAV